MWSLILLSFFRIFLRLLDWLWETTNAMKTILKHTHYTIYMQKCFKCDQCEQDLVMRFEFCKHVVYNCFIFRIPDLHIFTFSVICVMNWGEVQIHWETTCYNSYTIYKNELLQFLVIKTNLFSYSSIHQFNLFVFQDIGVMCVNRGGQVQSHWETTC